MANTIHQAHMGGNDPDQSMDAVSEIVKEVPYNTTDQITNEQIDRLILFYQCIVISGQAEPWPPDEQRFVHNRHRTKALKYFAIVVLLVVIFGSIRRASNIPSLNIEDTSDDNRQKLIMKVDEKCDCSNAILEDKLHVNTNDEMIDLIIYDEPNVEDMFKEISTTEDVDNSTYNIIAILPNESQDDIHSTDNGNEKAGQTSLAVDNFSSSKTEQNGAVSSEDTHLTNIHMLKETNPINSSEKFLENQAV